MDIPSSLAIIALAGLIHASFQLSVSVLTLLSGHSIGQRHSLAKLLGLTSSFVVGAGVMIMLLLAFVSFVSWQLFGAYTPQLVWATCCGLLLGVALSVWLFYYRGVGTTIWMPRNLASYLTKRTSATKNSGEAFGLGLTSVAGEILFIAAPIFAAALVLIQLPPVWQLAGVALYTFVSMLSLLTVWVLIGSGHNLGQIQKWRDENKQFLQFAAGAGLIVLSFFIFVTEILASRIGYR